MYLNPNIPSETILKAFDNVKQRTKGDLEAELAKWEQYEIENNTRKDITEGTFIYRMHVCDRKIKAIKYKLNHLYGV